MSGMEKAGEATMDEVLASIRRLLAEEPAASPLPPPQRVAAPIPGVPSPSAAPMNSASPLGSNAGSAIPPPPAPKPAGPAAMTEAVPALKAQAPSTPDAPKLAASEPTKAPQKPAPLAAAPLSIDEVLGLADDSLKPQRAAEKPASATPALAAAPVPPATPAAPSAASPFGGAPSWLFPKPPAGEPLGDKAVAPESKPAEKPAEEKPAETKTAETKAAPAQSAATPDLGAVIPGRPEPAPQALRDEAKTAAPAPTPSPAPAPARSPATNTGFVSPALPERTNAPTAPRPESGPVERQPTLAERLVNQVLVAKPAPSPKPAPATAASGVNGSDKATSDASPAAPAKPLPEQKPPEPAAEQLAKSAAASDAKPKVNGTTDGAHMPKAPGAAAAPAKVPVAKPAHDTPMPPQAARAMVANVMSGAVPPASAQAPAPSQPTAEQVRTMEDTVAELLRPMLRQWLDANMPRIVEKALRVELAASAKPAPKPERPN